MNPRTTSAGRQYGRTSSFSAEAAAHPTGSAYRREPEPKDRGCTIGVILNWPISMPSNSTVQMMACGRAVC